MLKSIFIVLFLTTVVLCGEAESIIKRMKSKYAQEKCWSLCNLVTDMPMDTAVGFSSRTEYINVDGYGAVVAVVDDSSEVEKTWMVGVTYWVCGTKNKKYRVHYYRKNSKNVLYEVRRLNVVERF